MGDCKSGKSKRKIPTPEEFAEWKKSQIENQKKTIKQNQKIEEENKIIRELYSKEEIERWMKEKQFPLHEAIYQNQFDLVDSILGYLPSTSLIHLINKKVGDDGMAPLHVAAFWGYSDICSLLIEFGANLNIQSEKEGATPLILAVIQEKYETVKFLLSFAEPITTQSSSSSSSSFSVSRNDGKGKNYELDVFVRSKNIGWTALHYAISKGNERIVSQLLKYTPKSGQGSLFFNSPSSPSSSPSSSSSSTTTTTTSTSTSTSYTRYSNKYKSSNILGKTGVTLSSMSRRDRFNRQKNEIQQTNQNEYSSSSSSPSSSSPSIFNERDINYKTRDEGWNVIHLVCKFGFVHLFPLLSNWNPNYESFAFGTFTFPLDECILSGNRQPAEWLLDQKKVFKTINEVTADRDNISPLMLAVKMNYPSEFVRKLLDNGADIGMRSYIEGKNALHFAAENGNVNLLNLLLDYKSDVNSKSIPDQFLSMNVWNKNESCDSYTPLHLAALKGHSHLIELILGRGGQINEQTDKQKKTALHIACQYSYYETVESLLLNYKNIVNINLQTSNGMTALHYAIQSGSDQIIQLLLKSDADLEIEAQINGLSLNGFQLSCQLGSVSVVSRIGQWIKTHPKLLPLLEKQTENSLTPLHIATLYSHVSVMEHLLSLGVSIEARTSKQMGGLTSLMIASSAGSPLAVKTLLKHGAQVNAESLDGRITALMIGQDHREVIKVLLDYGANIHHISSQNRTPLDSIQIRKEVEKRVFKKPLPQWNNDDVLVWLETLDIDQKEIAHSKLLFKEKKVVGNKLVKISEDELLKEYEINNPTTRSVIIDSKKRAYNMFVFGSQLKDEL